MLIKQLDPTLKSTSGLKIQITMNLKVPFFFFDHLILQLKSIKYFLQENIFSFYYFSAHVFIDDGMEENKSQDRQCNRFVKQLVDVIELAAT